MKKLTLLLFLSRVLLANSEKEIQTELILAEPGDTIIIKAGIHSIRGTLSMEGKQDVVIRGMGMDQSILSFKDQTEGAQGISITNCKNIVLQDFSVQDTKGDGIKAQDTDGIIFRRIKAEWTGGPQESNGAYGLYPVLCQNVLVEESISIGASDAGIYVGQSRDIIVRNSEARHNVAGFEIENSWNAKVYGNHAYDNTGGILIFDLPDLVQKKGGNVQVYENVVENNNLDNFAPKGSIVAKVPAGTGIMILAASSIHVFNNTIRNHKSVSSAVISYFMTEETIKDSLYNPYTSNIHIYDNIFEREPQIPTLKHDIGLLFLVKFGRHVPEIVYDGMQDPEFTDENGRPLPGQGLCIGNNKGAGFVNLDLETNFQSWYSPFFANFSTDMTPFSCDGKHLEVAAESGQ